MSVISKLLATDYKYTSCDVIFHPGLTCWESISRDLLLYIPSNIKFFFPFALIPLLMRLKRVNKDLIKNYFLYFAELTFGGYIVGNTITGSICLLRNLCGKYSVFDVGVLPGFLAAFWIFIFSNRVSRFYSVSVAQALLEAFLRSKHNSFTRALQNSRFLQTFLFMICSSVVLQMIRQHRFKIFWFVTPPPPAYELKSENTQGKIEKHNTKCTHRIPCQNFILNGIKEYFLIGFALENIKILVKKIKDIKSISDYFQKMNIYAISFLVSYVGIYRVSYCLLNKYSEIDADTVHLLAGCLGGISFSCYPKPLILSYAIVIVIETMWRNLQKRKEKSPNLLRKILSLPAGRMIFPLTLSSLVHVFLFHPSLPKLGATFVNGATNSKGDMFVKNLSNVVWSSQNIL